MQQQAVVGLLQIKVAPKYVVVVFDLELGEADANSSYMYKISDWHRFTDMNVHIEQESLIANLYFLFLYFKGILALFQLQTKCSIERRRQFEEHY